MEQALMMYRWFRANLKAPWTMAVVAVTILFTCFVLMDDQAFGTITAFKFSLVIIGAFGTNLVAAVSVRAFLTMFLMFIGILLIATVAAVHLNAEAFKDAAFENMMLMVGGFIGALVTNLLERLKPVEKYRGYTLEAAVQALGEMEEENRRLRAGQQ